LGCEPASAALRIKSRKFDPFARQPQASRVEHGTSQEHAGRPGIDLEDQLMIRL
jgi:hypothetical protein